MHKNSSTRQDNHQENIQHVSKMRVAVADLRKYMDLVAHLDEDIVNKSGVILIPKGTELSSLAKFADNLEKTIISWGINKISIELRSQINMRELEEVIKSSESFSGIDSKFARDTVEQVGDVYSRISNGICESEDISKLMDSGRTLAKVASETSEIMLCLGRVRANDEYTYVHSLNVGLMCGFLANRIFRGDAEMVQRLSIGGVLHDLGKARIPNEILNKPGPLTDSEFDIMKKHSALGEELAKQLGVSDPKILSVIRGHHERFCGNGYPDAVSSNNIPIEARISAVADVFDALTARRVYKEPMQSRKALGIMMGDARLHFDPDVLRELLLSIGIYPPGTAVELSDGSLGVVVGNGGENLIRPHVMLKVDTQGRNISEIKIIDLHSHESVFIKNTINSLDKIGF